MNTNQIISVTELKTLIAQHGVESVMIDGQFDEEKDVSSLEDDQEFNVVINYGHEVQFHLISDDVRVIITTGLKGRCENTGWVA